MLLRPPVDWSELDPEHRRLLAQAIHFLLDEVEDVLGKELGQARPANTTAVSIYSPPTGIITKITGITVAETAGAAAKFRIFLDNDGTTYDQTTALFYDVTIPANTTAFPLDRGEALWMDDASGNLAVRTDTNSALTFTVHGEENLITRA